MECLMNCVRKGTSSCSKCFDYDLSCSGNTTVDYSAFVKHSLCSGINTCKSPEEIVTYIEDKIKIYHKVKDGSMDEVISALNDILRFIKGK